MTKNPFMRSRRSRANAGWTAATMAAGLLTMAATQGVRAQDSLPAGGWLLSPLNSSLTFQSVKKGTVVETSKFASFDGEIGEDGDAVIRVVLESVDTGVDLRNVRMRFLFFETYKYPLATISAKVDRAAFASLPQKRRINATLPVTLALHSAKKTYDVPVTVTMIDADTVSVASSAPVIVAVDDFGLTPGLQKLSQAVGDIDITPSTSVSFDMVFDAETPSAAPSAETVAATPATPGPTGALESAGDLTAEECANRFDVLSRTQAIYFRSASARIDVEKSRPLLATVAEIVRRCPTLSVEVAGHTDADGGETYNQRLSERRATAVVDYLAREGVAATRLSSVGYGEARPVVDNSTPDNKSRNRRIEFHARGS